VGRQSFARLHESYIASRRERRYSPVSEANVDAALRPFFEGLRKKRILDIRRVTESHLASHVRRLRTMKSARGRPFSAATVALRLGTLRAFFSFLESRRLLLRNPAHELTLPAVRQLPRHVLSERQAERLMTAPPSSTNLGRRNRAMLELLYGVGLRLSECQRLDLTDVDLQSAYVLVRNGKGQKDRVVPLTGRAARAIDIYLRGSRPNLSHGPGEAALFLGRMGQRVTGSIIKTVVWKLGRELGFPRALGTHALRHACATHLLRHGADVRHIQQLLGHKDLRTTQLYTHVAILDLKAMMTRSHPRDKG
jgi:integrase/recombinase XerD